MKGKKPVAEISVITTSMNYGEYIEECIKSVLDLKAPFKFKINHIIMDGGSTDNTAEIVGKYGDKVHFYMNKGEGQTAALIHAMKIIEKKFPGTHYIGWLNADDYYRPCWLEASITALRKEKGNVAMTCAGYGQLGVPKHLKKKVAKLQTKALTKHIPYVRLHRMMKGNRICQPTVCIRFYAFKDIKKKDGYYFNPNHHYCQDVDIWMRFLIHGYRIRRLRVVVATLRRHPLRMTRTHGSQQREEGNLIRKLMAEKLRKIRATVENVIPSGC